jgi:hypothetical protein
VKSGADKSQKGSLSTEQTVSLGCAVLELQLKPLYDTRIKLQSKI